ncbi:carbohydrate-binding module family 18 protein [Zasmidium cellare ATCC 36951]|uniref:Carbohydrate-binding module family 18 protein n=1 Tax=Zasmidium cellare ATCC 36951 TaxID=1080233 RepID=A0A6A6D6R5_ZASCE|nr:carbohydrate-binding module family 18 protein [Zasmidium cellare ATCC 36951]KAF2173922.1 carbohydrate-binding module family 18 protein [Zasmidium cellare ATCC 36951]
MRRPSGRQCFFGFCSVALVYIALTGLVVHLTKGSNLAELAENKAWVASSKYWLDRQLCTWLGLCGVQHWVFKSAWTWEEVDDDDDTVDEVRLPEWWTSGEEDPNSWSREEIQRREIPQYVLDHAPYVHLFSGEEYWPSDLGDHLIHTSPFLNYSKILDLSEDRNLTNLNELNDYTVGQHGRFMYLQSDDNVEEKPEWLASEKNIPKVPERTAGDDNEDPPWPSLDDIKDFDLESAKQQALANHPPKESSQEAYPQMWPAELVVSEDGRCGGSSGFTCTGSKFGRCCSIYGWCGKSDDYCGDPCDPLSGTCYDPYNPPRGPHPDLRRRSLDVKAERHRPEEGGRSSAPAILVVVPKDDGIVDAFWFFFYSYNLGQRVLNIRFGNHVGDWEHTTIRFKNGKPHSVFLSEHDFGQAYTWKAMEKYIPSYDGSGTMIGSWSNETAARHAKRPVVYSAVGSHAMYGTPGLHPYILPFGLLHDETDRGPLWDPAQNLQSYTYDYRTREVRASTLNPLSPIGWFHYGGHWGDKYYPLSDPRQYRFAGQYHYVNGPTGPKFKNLGRSKICQGAGDCAVRHWLGGSKPAAHSPPEEEVEEGGLPGGNVTDTT